MRMKLSAGGVVTIWRVWWSVQRKSVQKVVPKLLHVGESYKRCVGTFRVAVFHQCVVMRL